MRRFIAPLLILLILVVLQAQLWLGQGSITDIREQQAKLDEQLKSNEKATQTNAQLQAEIDDLRSGLEMVEERARQELGMVKPNEIFIQIAPQKMP